MKVNILLFGISKEIVGASSKEVNINSEFTVQKLRELLLQQYPEMRNLKSVMIAVNQKYVADDHLISENDEVAIIPPVSGG